MTIEKPWGLQWAIRVFNTIDLSASEQAGSSRGSRVYMVDDGQGSSQGGADTYCGQCDQYDDLEDVSDVLVNLWDFNDFGGADDKYSMIDDDFEVFLLDLAKSVGSALPHHGMGGVATHVLRRH